MKPTPDTKPTGTPDHDKKTIGVVGLGYVGLPLAVAFAKKGHRVIGFDVDPERIEQLRHWKDRTGEVDTADLVAVKDCFWPTKRVTSLRSPEIHIVAVPTPVDARNVPDLSLLLKACELLGKNMSSGSIVVFESTVYPGCTEDVCIPALEAASGMEEGVDFFVGYSPERVNPGDKQHTLENVSKLVACPHEETREELRQLYCQVAGKVFVNRSIKVVEAAKAIENAQRDINIAFVNELAMMFAKMGIDSREVLAAARTKWNFLDFRPGLVGGHCIGVDPYYLAHRAQEFGYHPEVILAGRRTNEAVAQHIALRLYKRMRKQVLFDEFYRVLVLGVTFKEDCPDTRNSKVFDVIRELREMGCVVCLCDPLAGLDYSQEDNVKPDHIYGLEWDGIILAVPHKEFQAIDFIKLKREKAVVFDVKGVLPDAIAELRL